MSLGVCVCVCMSSLVSFQVLIEGVCLEQLGHLLVEPRNQLIDGLLPRLLLVALVVDCIKEVSERFLDHLPEHLWKLFGVCVCGGWFG